MLRSLAVAAIILTVCAVAFLASCVPPPAQTYYAQPAYGAQYQPQPGYGTAYAAAPAAPPAPAGAYANTAAAASAAAPSSAPANPRHVRFNGAELDARAWQVVAQLEQAYQTRLPDGDYW